jgi:primary-amine oxidase
MSTAAIQTLGQAGPATPDHPLTPLTADEIRAVRRIVDAHSLLGDAARFVYVALDEPDKAAVLSFRAGDPINRRARVVLLDRATGLGTDLVVSITEGRVVHQVSIDAATEGQVPILDEEFEDIELFLLESPEWLGAMGKRGIDPGNVRAAPLSAGVFGHKDEVCRRIVRVLAFHQQDRADLPWAHPIDGVVAYVDLTQRRVVKVIDDIVLPIPAERGQWNAAPHTVPARTTSSRSRSPNPKGRAFGSRAIRSPGRIGHSGLDSTSARDSPCTSCLFATATSTDR